MGNKRPGRSAFLEICVSVCLFTAVAAVCLLCFARAHILQERADWEAACMVLAGDAAEVFLSGSSAKDIEGRFVSLFGACKNGDALEYSAGGYRVQVMVKERELLECTVRITGKDLTYKMYVQKAAGGEACRDE